MATVTGSKRPAEVALVADGAEPAIPNTSMLAIPARKLTKTQRRRERRQTPAEKLEYQYRIQVQKCAQENNATRALEVYEQMKSEGMNVAPYIYNVVINVCSKANDPAAFKDGAYKVYQDMKQANASSKQRKKSDSGEPIYSAMIKLCSKAQDFDACETIIAEMEAAKVEPKLRTFGPLLQAHSDAGNLDKCIWVHEKLLSYELELTEDDYVALLRACVKTGNSERFYAFLESFIDEIWQPNLSTWDVLKDWFNSEAAQVDGRKWRITEGTVSKEGVCSVTGDQLQSVELSAEVTTELLAKIEKLVRTDEKRMAQWDEFKQWLEEFGPFDVVIDAANVGYCNQNFDGRRTDRERERERERGRWSAPNVESVDLDTLLEAPSPPANKDKVARRRRKKRQSLSERFHAPRRHAASAARPPRAPSFDEPNPLNRSRLHRSRTETGRRPAPMPEEDPAPIYHSYEDPGYLAGDPIELQPFDADCILGSPINSPSVIHARWGEPVDDPDEENLCTEFKPNPFKLGFCINCMKQHDVKDDGEVVAMKEYKRIARPTIAKTAANALDNPSAIPIPRSSITMMSDSGRESDIDLAQLLAQRRDVLMKLDRLDKQKTILKRQQSAGTMGRRTGALIRVFLRKF
ncbi:hypothetical protein AM588_10004746 [Phytophthora nicotianae]|uniref:ribonuclease P n=1 Tax=Phytophthora nicotianae TaxID=4792 RepID=A0A0W8DCP4_PHYNI|nr:hypothetical protein AM588_10004746 [Phytophthora nicotianae]